MQNMYILNNQDRSILEKVILYYSKITSSSKWAILYLHAFGNLTKNTMLEFEDEVNNRKNPEILSHSKLTEILNQIEVINEILIIADHNTQKIRRFSSDNDMYNECDLTIELCDSTYWQVSSNNTDLLDFLKKEFDIEYS